jgi:hypothetical protein
LYFFFGGCGKIRAKDNLPVTELPHHTVFVGFTQLFNNLGREKRGFPEALTPKGAAELAGGALLFGEDGGKHHSSTLAWVLSRIVSG